MSLMSLRAARTAATVALAGATVAACASTSSTSRAPSSSTSHAAATTTLTVGLLPIPDAAGYYTAEAQGYFTQRGIRVRNETIAGGATLVPALESGAMNVGFSNLVSVLQAGEKNLGVECLAGTLRKPATGHNLSLVVSPKYATQVRSASDLDGKSIAVNTLDNINQLIADAWMQANGGNWRSVHYVAVDFPDMPAAIAKGEVVAAITDEPFTTIALNDGAKLLSARPYQVFATAPVFSCWLASTTWVDSHQQVAKAFVAALNEADSYIAAHPSYVRQILPRYIHISSKLADTIDLSQITTSLNVSDLRVWQTEALKFGMLSTPVKNLSALIAKLG